MKTSVFVATNLHGFIARANEALDFLHAPGGDPEPHGCEEFFATVHHLASCAGRRTPEEGPP